MKHTLNVDTLRKGIIEPQHQPKYYCTVQHKSVAHIDCHTWPTSAQQWTTNGWMWKAWTKRMAWFKGICDPKKPIIIVRSPCKHNNIHIPPKDKYTKYVCSAPPTATPYNFMNSPFFGFVVATTLFGGLAKLMNGFVLFLLLLTKKTCVQKPKIN